jgi:hypothetical protein
MLHFVQHDKRGVIPSAFFVIPSACEESSAWMLRFAQHDKSDSVIPSESEESRAMWMLHCAQHDKVVDASLGFASLSMTVHLAGSRVIIGSIRILFSECAFT